MSECLRVLVLVVFVLLRLMDIFIFYTLDCCNGSTLFSAVQSTIFFHLAPQYFAPDCFNCSRYLFHTAEAQWMKCRYIVAICIFQSVLNGNLILFQLFAACSVDVLILFIFCLAGEIIIEANDLSSDAYSLDWYQYNWRSKYIVWFMILRTQKYYYFASFKSLNCSLETFVNVWLQFYFNSKKKKKTHLLNTYSIQFSELYFIKKIFSSEYLFGKQIFTSNICISDHTKSWRCFGYASKHEMNRKRAKQFFCSFNRTDLKKKKLSKSWWTDAFYVTYKQFFVRHTGDENTSRQFQ